MGYRIATGVAILGLLAACSTTASNLRLRRVVLYQNGVGYFEHAGRTDDAGLRLRVRAHELDDVLTTLTVADRTSGGSSPVAPMAAVPQGEPDDIRALTVNLGDDARDVAVAYATQTSAWRASYRVILPDGRGPGDTLLQAWAIIDNTTAEDWHDVELTLATARPLSFATDLRSPRLVERPNVTGHRAPPVATGPVFAESSRGRDDGDGIWDEDDLCPDEPEDIDGFEDEDGCPDPDNDRDGILDVDDQCPTDPELLNGFSDEDGCPDRGSVRVEADRVTIDDRIHFEANGATIPESATPVLASVAATLTGHPEIARVEIHGHADSHEASPWSLSAERAAAVRAALIEAGVAAARLNDVAHGATQPLALGAQGTARHRNQHVDFSVAAIPGDAPDMGPTTAGHDSVGMRSNEVARTVSGLELPRTAPGGTRFIVSRPVSVAAGASAMVAMLGRRVAGEEVLLLRRDSAVPDSDVHPFRAARIGNAGGIDLVPGPISLFARGEFVGQGLLRGVSSEEDLFIPYALDDASTVDVGYEEQEIPVRLIALAEGQLRVERKRVRQTRYAIVPGSHAPARLFIRHPRAEGYAAVDLPPGTDESTDALLAPLPIDAGRRSELLIVEQRTIAASIDLLTDLTTDVRPYLESDVLAPEVAERLNQLLEDRRLLAELGERLALLHVRLRESSERSTELRRSVAALEGAPGGPSTVRRRLARRLEQAVADGEGLAVELADLRAREAEARAGLREAVVELRIEGIDG